MTQKEEIINKEEWKQGDHLGVSYKSPSGRWGGEDYDECTLTITTLKEERTGEGFANGVDVM